MKLTRKIRSFRRRYKITQEEFAELVGTTRTTVSLWESKKTEPNQEAIKRKIMEVLERGKPVVVKKGK